MSVTVLSYNDYKQQLPACYPDVILANTYALYLQSLRKVCPDVVIDNKPPDILPFDVTSYVHANAQKPGYCYLYMFSEKNIRGVLKFLGKNPRLEDVLSVRFRSWNVPALRMLFLSVNSDGTYHVGLTGTWPLLEVLGHLRVQGVAIPPELFKFIPRVTLDYQFDLDLPLGTDVSTLVPPIREFDDVIGLDLIEYPVGTKFFLKKNKPEFSSVVVRIDENRFSRVHSEERDYSLDVLTCGIVHGRSYVLLESTSTSCCGRRMKPIQHLMICDSASEVEYVADFSKYKYDEYRSDMVVKFSSSREFSEIMAQVDIVYRLFTVWWTLSGGVVSTNHALGRGSEAVYDHYRDYLNYHGQFKDEFYQCLDRWMLCGDVLGAVVSSDTSVGSVEGKLSDRYKKLLHNFDGFHFSMNDPLSTEIYCSLAEYVLLNLRTNINPYWLC